MSEYTLPNEPGYYIDKEDDLWRLTGPGEWVFPEENELSGRAERYAPFTRLMTESQWEAKQIERHADLIAELRAVDSKAAGRNWGLIQRAAHALASTIKGSK